MFELKQHVKGVHGERITVRFEPMQAKKLEGIAGHEGWKISDMIREAVDHWVEEYKKRPGSKQLSFL
jgi:predicted DNA-binding ribbon-helix-helix protein